MTTDEYKLALDAACDLARLGEGNPARLEEMVRDRLDGVGRVEYVKVVNAETLGAMPSIRGSARLLVSVAFSHTSLVDSIGVEVPESKGLVP